MLLSPDWYTTIPNCANLIYLSTDVIFSEKPIDLREEKFVENCGALFIFDFHLTRVFFFLMAWVFLCDPATKAIQFPLSATTIESKSRPILHGKPACISRMAHDGRIIRLLSGLGILISNY